ncbi:MAG: GNAT family N-acetyltransferase [Lachnospiraceae bacterium]|jgi:ribosomal protein S18 acetylase RimI-like enzyme|nr:GNAT family N-acetyltransferase [Lachnospiraceae bacterium]
MSSYHFMTACEGDIPEIVSIYHRLIGTPGCTWDLNYPTIDTAHSDVSAKSLFILRDDRQIIAVASTEPADDLAHLEWLPKRPCQLARIGVIPPMQNSGIGTFILKEVMTTARHRGHDGIIMLVSKTNPAALALYESNGFTRCGEAFMYDVDFYCYQITFHTD